MNLIKTFFYFMIFLSTSLFSKDLITPISEVKFNHEKANLGKELFFDEKLSYNDTISCASCHIISQGGDDNNKVSTGVNGQKGDRNAPTVLNAVFNSTQFWDGRVNDLFEQVSGPIHNPIEMNSTLELVVEKLSKIESYQTKFRKLYQDGLTKNNIMDAISEFEKSLTTPNSKFDKFLKGEKTILTKDELLGYKLFKDYGCISCHNGINVGGNIFQKIGVMKDFKTKDLGRYNITKNIDDKYYFKVPTLRNIELTSPYFHDGQTATLKEAVKLMSEYQIGFEIPDEEIDLIVKFLKTLTGEIPKVSK